MYILTHFQQKPNKLVPNAHRKDSPRPHPLLKLESSLFEIYFISFQDFILFFLFDSVHNIMFLKKIKMM